MGRKGWREGPLIRVRGERGNLLTHSAIANQAAADPAVGRRVDPAVGPRVVAIRPAKRSSSHRSGACGPRVLPTYLRYPEVGA